MEAAQLLASIRREIAEFEEDIRDDLLILEQFASRG